jgi:hypothetical protein
MPRLACAVAAVIAVVGLVAGCGSSSSPEVQRSLRQLPEMIKGLNLPSVPIPVTIGENGRVTNVGGFDAAMVDDLAERFLGYKLLGSMALLTEDQVAWLKQANIQHVTLALRPEGLFVLVNGRALPYLDWQTMGDEDVMANLIEILGRMQSKPGSGEAFLITPENYEVLQAVLPVARNIGLRLDVQLPRDPDQEPIPAPDSSAFSLGLTNAELTDMPANAASVDLAYKELPDGTWVPSLLGLSTAELQQAARPLGLRIPTWRLRRDIQKRLDAEGFQNLGLEWRADGVYMTVDDKLMPHLAWSNATLTHLAEVLNQLYPPGSTLPDDAAYVPVLRAVAPMLNDLSLVARVQFPEDR